MNRIDVENLLESEDDWEGNELAMLCSKRVSDALGTCWAMFKSRYPGKEELDFVHFLAEPLNIPSSKIGQAFGDVDLNKLGERLKYGELHTDPEAEFLLALKFQYIKMLQVILNMTGRISDLKIVNIVKYSLDSELYLGIAKSLFLSKEDKNLHVTKAISVRHAANRERRNMVLMIYAESRAKFPSKNKAAKVISKMLSMPEKTVRNIITKE